MSVHLPECPWTPASLLHNDHLCICDRLREAEQRGYVRGVAQVQEVAYADGQRDEREKWEANGPYFTSVVHACCEERERIRKAVEALMETAHWRLLTREEAEAAVLAVIDGEAP